MYIPYLRAKRNELLALRDLCHLPFNNTKISILLEPINGFDSVFKSTVRDLNQQNVSINLIVNPKIGGLSTNTTLIHNFINDQRNIGITNIIPTYIFDNVIDLNYASHSINAHNYSSNNGYSLIINKRINDINAVQSFLTTNSNLRFTFLKSDISPSYKQLFSSTAHLSDPFNLQQKNSLYLNTPTELFTDVHQYYINDGYIAFSDFLTIGELFSEGGWAPYAVAIHLTYQESDGTIWVAHFVSDSNSDNRDTAGKIGEALNKLVAFINNRGINTLACQEFRRIHAAGTNPGLGGLKKLSVMHHIELIQSII